MPTKEEYAQLATQVYMKTDENRTPIADGWNEVWYEDNSHPSTQDEIAYRGV